MDKGQRKMEYQSPPREAAQEDLGRSTLIGVAAAVGLIALFFWSLLF